MRRFHSALLALPIAVVIHVDRHLAPRWPDRPGRAATAIVGDRRVGPVRRTLETRGPR